MTSVPQAPTIGTPTNITGSAYGSTVSASVPVTANATGGKAEFAFYTDTDSAFISALPLIQHRYPTYDESDEQFMVDKTNEIASEVQRKWSDIIHNSADKTQICALHNCID